MRFSEAFLAMGDRAIKKKSFDAVYFMRDGVFMCLDNNKTEQVGMIAINGDSWEVVDLPNPFEIVRFSLAIEHLVQGKIIESCSGHKYKLCSAWIGRQSSIGWSSVDIRTKEALEPWKVFL